MINYFSDDQLTLHQAAQLVNKSFPTVYRWTTSGIGGIRLETICDGERRLTSRGALQTFFERVTEYRNGKLKSARHDEKAAGIGEA